MRDYSIWVLEYAYVPDYPVGGVIYGKHNAGHRRLPYAYAVIRGRDRLIMVDVGFNDRAYGKELGDLYGVTGWHSPKEVLGQIGLDPRDVDTVLVTHAHFDHMGNLDAFPNAHVYVQEREVARSIWAMSQPTRLGFLSTAVDPGDVLACVDRARSGRLTLVDGDRDNVLPGIDLRVAYDTHTWASMYVVVRNDGASSSVDPWVLAGDLVYVYENLGVDGSSNSVSQPYTPVGFAIGSQANLVLTLDDIMKAAGGDHRRVVPVHEQRLTENYPSRMTREGLRVSEICVASWDSSKLG